MACHPMPCHPCDAIAMPWHMPWHMTWYHMSCRAMGYSMACLGTYHVMPGLPWLAMTLAKACLGICPGLPGRMPTPTPCHSMAAWLISWHAMEQMPGPATAHAIAYAKASRLPSRAGMDGPWYQSQFVVLLTGLCLVAMLLACLRVLQSFPIPPLMYCKMAGPKYVLSQS